MRNIEDTMTIVKTASNQRKINIPDDTLIMSSVKSADILMTFSAQSMNRCTRTCYYHILTVIIQIANPPNVFVMNGIYNDLVRRLLYLAERPQGKIKGTKKGDNCHPD